MTEQISTLARLCGLLRNWWQADRVRVSPREGRLLRLQPGCILLIGARRVEVVARRADGDGVVYVCDDGQVRGELRVCPGSSEIYWRDGNDEQHILAAGEIEVFAPATSRGRFLR